MKHITKVAVLVVVLYLFIGLIVTFGFIPESARQSIPNILESVFLWPAIFFIQVR